VAGQQQEQHPQQQHPQQQQEEVVAAPGLLGCASKGSWCWKMTPVVTVMGWRRTKGSGRPGPLQQQEEQQQEAEAAKMLVWQQLQLVAHLVTSHAVCCHVGGWQAQLLLRLLQQDAGVQAEV
jgi:hypothetical protein